MKLKAVSEIMLTLLFASIVMVLASPIPVIAQTNSTTTVYLDPPTINGTVIGQEFTVDINIRDAPNMTGWQASVSFNANIIECTDFIQGEFLQTVGTTYWTKEINNTAGVITAECSLLMGAEANGGGRLAYATFRVIASGVSDLHLRDVEVFEWVDATKTMIAVNIIDVYTVVVETTHYTVVTVSNSTGGFYDHAFNLALKELSFNVTGPYPGFSNVTIPKGLLSTDPPRVWAVIINGTRLSTEQRTVTENATHTSIYFTYPPGINDIQITTRLKPVGGVWIPVDKLSLLVPYVGLSLTITVTTAIAVAFFKYRKKK